MGQANAIATALRTHKNTATEIVAFNGTELKMVTRPLQHNAVK
jgi:hypothetical protein